VIDTKKEITIEYSLFSILKSGYFILVQTKGMEKFNKRNLMIITSELFVIQSKRILEELSDYILNFYLDDINNIELCELNISDDFPPINLKLVSVNNIPNYLVSSKNVLDEITKLSIDKNIKIKTEETLKLGKPKLYVIKGGKI
jgi:hypothetical protein